MNRWTLFEVVVNILQGGLFAFFGISVFPPKNGSSSNFRYGMSVWSASSLILTLFTFFPLDLLFLDWLIVLCVFIILTSALRSGPLFSRIIWSIVYFATMGCLIYLVMTIALSMPDVTPEFLLTSTYGRIIYVLATNGVLVSMTFIMIRIVRRTSINLDIRVVLVSISLIATNLLVLFILLEYTAVMPEDIMSPVALVVSAVALLVVNTLVMWMFQHINKQNQSVVELTATAQRVEMQAKHQGEIGRIESDLRSFRHDSHTHFQYLLMQAEAGEIEVLKMYLRKLTADLDQLTMPISTGNTVMDAILNVKSHIAEHEGIRFEVDAMLPSALPFEDNDLVIIIGNALDNAIDASKQISSDEDRTIEVVMRVNHHVLVISVVNRMVDTPKKKGIYALTSKANQNSHGLGLKIIDDHVSKYGGSMDIKQHHQVFELNLIFPVNGKT